MKKGRVFLKRIKPQPEPEQYQSASSFNADKLTTYFFEWLTRMERLEMNMARQRMEIQELSELIDKLRMLKIGEEAVPRNYMLATPEV